MTLGVAAGLGVLAIAGGCLFLVLALRVDHLRRSAPRPAPPARSTPPTLVLLPCRNEELDVLPCLDSLLASTSPARVRVIDDGSTDTTSDLVRGRLGPGPAPGRLELIAAAPLPAGWRGKVHALHCGLAGAEEPWLLSTDADTRHAPDALARAHETAAVHGLDAISLSGHQTTATVGEALVTPPVFALLDALVRDWHALADGRGPAILNGQFLLVRRAALEAIGGFGIVRAAPIDDVYLARALVAGGFRTGLLRAPDALSVRMYIGFVASFHGWRRNLAGILTGEPGRTAAILAATLGPPVGLVAALVAGSFVAAAAGWIAGVAASSLLRRGSGHPVGGGLLYPVDALVLGAIVALGAWDRWRGQLQGWKGRAMPVG